MECRFAILVRLSRHFHLPEVKIYDWSFNRKYSTASCAIAIGQPTIKLSDLLAYKKRSDEEAAAVLDELTAQAQELKMGYE